MAEITAGDLRRRITHGCNPYRRHRRPEAVSVFCCDVDLQVKRLRPQLRGVMHGMAQGMTQAAIAEGMDVSLRQVGRIVSENRDQLWTF